MGSVTTSKNLAVSPDALWKTIVDTSTWDSWLTIHAGWLEAPPAELTVGSRLVEKVVMLGMANKLEWVVEEVEDGRRLSIAGTGMAGVKSTFTFSLEPAADGSVVTIDASFSGALIVGALGKAVEKDAAQNLDDSIEKLAATASA